MKTYEYINLAKGDLTKIKTSVLEDLYIELCCISAEISMEASVGAEDPKEEAEISELLEKVCKELDARKPSGRIARLICLDRI